MTTTGTEVWRTELAEAFGQLRAEQLDRRDPSPLTGTITATPLGRAGAFRVTGSPQQVRRTPRAIAAAPADPLKVCIQQRGRAVVHQGASEVVLGPGELALYDTGRPYDLRLDGQWSCAVMTLPRDALGLGQSGLDDAMAHAWSATTGPGRLLHQLVSSCTEVDAPPDYGHAQLGEAGLQLMASLVHQRDRTEGGGAAADQQLRDRVRAYVRDHLGDPGLRHASVAAAHALSDRSLHRLFQSEPESVAGLIRELRLDAIRDALADPTQAQRSVMALAARWGFRNQPHFTRAFREHVGETPAAWRRRAIG